MYKNRKKIEDTLRTYARIIIRYNVIVNFEYSWCNTINSSLRRYIILRDMILKYHTISY